jgi:hypothetical protein
MESVTVFASQFPRPQLGRAGLDEGEDRMNETPTRLGFWCAMSVAVVCTATLATAAPQTKTSATQQYQQQLGSRFTSWDLNGDGYLDKEELAKAIRGKDARPYDAADPRSQVYTLTLVSLPQPAMVVQSTVADRLQQADPKKYSQLSDYQYLMLVDTNADKKISQKEFDTWAKGYARALASRDTALKSLQTAQTRLAKAKSAASKLSAQQAVTRANTSVNQALTQINAVPTAVQQALNVGPR